MDVRDICPLTRQLCESETTNNTRSAQGCYDIPRDNEAIVLAACTYRMWERTCGFGSRTAHSSTTLGRLASYFASQGVQKGNGQESKEEKQGVHTSHTQATQTDREASTPKQQKELTVHAGQVNNTAEEVQRVESAEAEEEADGGLATFIASMPMSVDEEQQQQQQEEGEEEDRAKCSANEQNQVKCEESTQAVESTAHTPQVKEVDVAVQLVPRTPSATAVMRTPPVAASASTSSPLSQRNSQQQQQILIQHEVSQRVSITHTPQESPLPRMAAESLSSMSAGAGRTPRTTSQVEKATLRSSNEREEVKSASKSVSTRLDFDMKDNSDVKVEQQLQTNTIHVLSKRAAKRQRAASLAVVQITSPLVQTDTGIHAQTSIRKKAPQGQSFAEEDNGIQGTTPRNSTTSVTSKGSSSSSARKQLVFAPQEEDSTPITTVSRSPLAMQVKQEDNDTVDVINNTPIGQEQPRCASNSSSLSSHSTPVTARTHSTRIAEAELFLATQKQRMQELNTNSSISPIATLRGHTAQYNEAIAQERQRSRTASSFAREASESCTRNINSNRGGMVKPEYNSVSSERHEGMTSSRSKLRRARSARRANFYSASISPTPAPQPCMSEFDLPHTSPSPIPTLRNDIIVRPQQRTGGKGGDEKTTNNSNKLNAVGDVTHNTPWQSLFTTSTSATGAARAENREVTAKSNASSAALVPRVMHKGPRMLRRKGGGGKHAALHTTEADEFALPRSFVLQGSTADTNQSQQHQTQQRAKSAGHNAWKRRRRQS